MRFSHPLPNRWFVSIARLNALPCHGRDQGFKSPTDRQNNVVNGWLLCTLPGTQSGAVRVRAATPNTQAVENRLSVNAVVNDHQARAGFKARHPRKRFYRLRFCLHNQWTLSSNGRTLPFGGRKAGSKSARVPKQHRGLLLDRKLRLSPQERGFESRPRYQLALQTLMVKPGLVSRRNTVRVRGRAPNNADVV